MENLSLSVENVSFYWTKKQILKAISFQLDGAQSVCLLGPNGAGKSTLLKLIASHTYCSNGTIKQALLDSNNDRNAYLNTIGYMPENAVIFPELTTREQLQLFAYNKCLSNPDDSIDEVIELCQLTTVLNKRTHQLSLGFKQRLNLAQALLNQPQLILMDEPLNGLDPHLIIEFRNIINKLKQKSQVLISTHYLAEAQSISDSVIILKEGQMLDQINLTDSSQEIDLEEIYMHHTQGESIKT